MKQAYQHQDSLVWMLNFWVNYFSSHGLFFLLPQMTEDATQHVNSILAFTPLCNHDISKIHLQFSFTGKLQNDSKTQAKLSKREQKKTLCSGYRDPLSKPVALITLLQSDYSAMLHWKTFMLLLLVYVSPSYAYANYKDLESNFIPKCCFPSTYIFIKIIFWLISPCFPQNAF